jgi:hypothetical protein
MTDLKFCHSLLEEAVAYLSGGHSRSTHEVNSQLEAVSFHEAVQQLCCNHLLRYLTNGRPMVQVRRHTFWTSISYQISIMPTAEGYQNWCCTRNFDEIKAFNKMLNSQIPDARLWGWETMDPRFDEPNPFLFAVVLEYSLRRAFRSHGRELLGKSESLFFLRPDSIFEASQILEPVPRSINYGTRFPDIKCFLPPSLTHGLNVSELSTEIVPCVWPIEFKLEKCANGSGNMRWVLEWDEGREFSDIKDTISVSLGNGPVSPFDAQEDSRKTLSIIHRPKGQIGSRTSLSVTFNTFEEARLVFEALQLLCRLDNIILSSQRSGETSLPLDGTRARQFADV